MSFNYLFNPIKIRGLELKNRVVFPAMGTKMVTEDKFITQQNIDYHVARVLGGCGLNFTEVCSVYAPASIKNYLSIAEDKYIPGLKQLSDAIHKAGGKAGIQLWLGGLVARYDSEAKIIIPSDVLIGENKVLSGASLEIIKEATKAFGEAAKRAVEAGYDTLEFHAGHNYTPHSFLSAFFNKRTDEYGGTLENRARFSIECIKAIRDNIPSDMPLFMRIDAHDDYLENGLTIEEVITFCKMAKDAGVDVLDVSRGNFSSKAIKYEVPSIDLPRGFNVENAARIKKETGMLTMAVGRINTPEQADKIIANKEADMVVIGRGQLADPNFCNKAEAEEADDIIRCVGCNQGCYDAFVSPDMPHITCMRNPALGKEVEYALIKTEKPKKVLVAGGGVAGLEAAMTLQQRGHHPIICEASLALGGQFVLAGVAPRKEEMKEAAIWMGEQALKNGIDIRLNTPITEQLLDELLPDEVIIAIGAEPMRLNIAGGDLKHVTHSHDVLDGKMEVQGNVVIIGGGLVGLEVAEYIEGKVAQITVVEMQDEVAKDLGDIRKVSVLENIEAAGVKTRTRSKCVEIKEDVVIIDKEGQLEELPYDFVVVAIGAKSRDSENITIACKRRGIPYHIIGDAIKARRALNSISEAAAIAREI